MNLRRALLTAALPAALFLCPQMAHAEALIGPRAGLEFNSSSFVLGGEFRYTLTNLGGSAKLVIRPGFDLFFNHGTSWELSGDLLFAFPVTPNVEPYVGPGIGVFDGGHAGLNIPIGVKFMNTNWVQPFVELRPTVGNGSIVCLLGGVAFRL